MDVRCERCQTEYELENSSVSEGGTSVQCTSCGYTFLVKRMVTGAPPPPIPESESAPPAAEWLLETSDGQFHRFRNLTSLQKWIIERKVTRDDKISRTGQAWRRLGEIVELAPFFDVVDEADKARADIPSPSQSPRPSPAGAPLAAQLKREAEWARSAATRPSPVASRPVAPPVAKPAATPDAALEAGSLRSSLRPSLASPTLYARGTNDDAMDFSEGVSEVPTAVVRLGGGAGWKILAGLVAVAALGYVGFTKHWFFPGAPGVDKTMPQRPSHAAPSAVAAAAPATAAAQLAAAAAAVPAPPATAAAEVAAAAVAAPPPGGVASGAAAPRAVGAASAAAAVPSAVEPSRVDPVATGERGGGRGDQSGAKSYESLVLAADRLLENGSTERAQKTYEAALRLRKDGLEAISGLGYVMLDRGRVPLAMAHFKRVLSVTPYGPALFGLAEAHRALGDDGAALEAYQRYLAVNPAGAESIAARRQIQLLKDAPAAAP